MWRVGLSSSYHVRQPCSASGQRPRYAPTYLQEAIYYLPPHIFLVGSEEFALEHAKYAFGNAEIGLEVFG